MIAKFAIFAIALALVESQNVLSQRNYSVMTELIDGLLNNYDKRLRPNYGGGPVEVEVSMHVLSFNSISDSDMDFTLDFYLRQYWIDPRLAFTNTAGLGKLRLGHDFGKMIWIPDTFIVNEKESFLHDVTMKNELILVNSTGEVVRSVRITATANCPMDLQDYPRDTQNCNLDLESYGATTEGIVYKWKTNNSITFSDSGVPLFDVVESKQKTMEFKVSTGKYSRVSAVFTFKRCWWSYMGQVFIPCTMLLVISWGSFFLKANSNNLRMVLCVLPLLLISIGSQCLMTQIPRTDYTKAIDIYLGFSMTLIFISLIAFTYIQSLPSEDEKDLENNQSKATKIDRFFRIAFPITFALFNVYYWTFY